MPAKKSVEAANSRQHLIGGDHHVIDMIKHVIYILTRQLSFARPKLYIDATVTPLVHVSFFPWRLLS